jgi:hypothetical protein
MQCTATQNIHTTVTEWLCLQQHRVVVNHNLDGAVPLRTAGLRCRYNSKGAASVLFLGGHSATEEHAMLLLLPGASTMPFLQKSN